LYLDRLTATNSGPSLHDALPISTLDLESAIIAGGTVTNHGLLDANTGLTNAINNATLITNDGTLEATGSGVELQIKSATTFNNSEPQNTSLNATHHVNTQTVTNT